MLERGLETNKNQKITNTAVETESLIHIYTHNNDTNK